MNTQIEKNIQIPPSQYGPYKSERRILVEDMQLGDSLFLKTANECANFCSMICKVYGKGSATQRSVEGGYRVWRVRRAATNGVS